MEVEFLYAEDRKRCQVKEGTRIVALSVSCPVCVCGEKYSLGETWTYRTLNHPSAKRNIYATVRLVDFPDSDHFLAWAEIMEIQDQGRNAKVFKGQVILVSIYQLHERLPGVHSVAA